MDDQTASEHVHLSQVTALRRIVEQLRLNLYTLEEQAAFIGIQPDTSGAPIAPTILAAPREIYKQFP